MIIEPKTGKQLSQLGQAPCPSWADFTPSGCPISSYRNIHIPIYRILPTYAIPVVRIPFI